MFNSIKTFFTTLSSKWNSLKILAEKDLSTLWAEYRTYFILAFAVIFTLKFRQWLIDFLINSSKKLYNQAQKQSQSYQLKENQDNKAADALIQQAAQLPSEEKTVDENWYKNE